MPGIGERNSFTPSSLSAFWFPAATQIDAGGGHPASLIDVNTGAVATPQGATGGTIEATGWGGQPCIKQNAEAWRSSAAIITNCFTGGQNWWTCIVGMPLAASGTIWSAGLSSDATKYMGLLESSVAGSQKWIQRFGAGAETQDTSTQFQGPFPYLWLLQCDSGGIHSYNRDGLIEQTFTRATGGALTVDAVLLGGLIQGGAVTLDSLFRWRHWLGNSGNLNAIQIGNLYRYFAADSNGLSWKRGMTGGLWSGKTYVICDEYGQSNDEDQSASNPALTAPNVKNLGLDSFVVPLGGRAWSVKTNTPFTTIFTTSGTGSACVVNWANQLWTNGTYTAADGLMFIPNGVGGSSMGSFWDVGATTSPPSWTAALGAVKLRLTEVMRNAPNPFIRKLRGYQGESETLVTVSATNWGSVTRAQVVVNEMDAYCAAQLFAFENATHHFVTILPTTNWTSATLSDWNIERASQNTLQSAIYPTTMKAIQSPSIDFTDGTNLHIGALGQTALGVLYANNN